MVWRQFLLPQRQYSSYWPNCCKGSGSLSPVLRLFLSASCGLQIAWYAWRLIKTRILWGKVAPTRNVMQIARRIKLLPSAIALLGYRGTMCSAGT